MGRNIQYQVHKENSYENLDISVDKQTQLLGENITIRNSLTNSSNLSLLQPDSAHTDSVDYTFLIRYLPTIQSIKGEIASVIGYFWISANHWSLYFVGILGGILVLSVSRYSLPVIKVLNIDFGSS